MRGLREIEESEAKRVIDWLRRPSPRDWLSARVVTLLSHYFISQTDERVAKAAAQDWIEILKSVPPWAVSNACRKYLAGSNGRRKPVPGDILGLALEELWLVNKAAKSLIDRGGHQTDLASRSPLTEEERRRRRDLVEKIKLPRIEGEKRHPQDVTQKNINEAAEILQQESESSEQHFTPSADLLETNLVKNHNIRLDDAK